MGKFDAETKAYMENSVHFADAFNYLIYGGKAVIQPSELKPLDVTEIAFPYGNEAREPVQKYRDVLKLWHVMRDEKAVYAVLGVENQSHIHYAMPVRCGLYDFLNYAEQVEQAGKSYRKNPAVGESGSRLTGAEFLSGFRKKDRLLPVITLVIYFGDLEWDGPVSLREMLNVEDENLLRFIPDYRLNLIVPSRMNDADFLRFQTDLGKVLEYIKYSGDQDKLQELVHRDDRYRNVETDSANLINLVTGSKLQLSVKEDRTDMCKAIEDMRNESYEQGRKKGREEVREEIREEVRDEVRDEIREEVREESSQEAISSVLKNMVANFK